MKRRILAALLTATMLLGLAGCGNTGDKKSDKTPETGKETVDSKETREVELNMVLTYYGRLEAEWDWLFDKFAEKELADKNIKVTVNAEYPSDETLLRSRFSSGDAPDVFVMHSKMDAPLYNKGGYLADLSDEPFVDKLLEGLIPSCTIDDKVIALPLENFSWSYVYNKEIFAENNITPPQTLSEMKKAIETLKANDVVPFELPYKTDYAAGWVTQVPMCALAATKVPDFYEKMNNKEPYFESMADAGLFDLIDMVNANGGKRPLEVNIDDGVADFAMGKAAMMLTGPWFADMIMEIDPEFQLGVAPFPLDDDPDNTVVMLAVSEVLGCSPDSPNLDVAKDFLNFIVDDSVTSEFFNKCKFNQVAENQEIDSRPWIEEGLTYVNEGKFYDEYPIPMAISDEMARLSQLYFSGEVTKEDFITGMNDIWAKTIETQ